VITVRDHMINEYRFPGITDFPTLRQRGLEHDMTAEPSIAERITPGLILGPFYPVQQPAVADHRLWRGAALPHGARRLQFDGHVCTLDGRPVVQAAVELWHADPAGRYPHPSAPEARQVDPDFVGYGRVSTDNDGRFTFASLVPGGYSAGEGRRAVHFHVQITGRCDRLLTQVFVPGDAAHGNDRWLCAAPRPGMLIARVCDDQPERLHLDWTAYLTRG
jgi:protocatechuate 3,4-dioxygenase, beta subunit